MPNVVAQAEYRFEKLSPDGVYAAWLDPDKVRRWMTHLVQLDSPQTRVTRVEIDARAGGWYFFSDVNADTGEESPAWGYYRALEPGKRLVFTWFVEPGEEEEDNSTVTLELTPQGSGCVARMSHEMDAEWAEYLEPTANAWRKMLQSIDATLG